MAPGYRSLSDEAPRHKADRDGCDPRHELREDRDGRSARPRVGEISRRSGSHRVEDVVFREFELHELAPQNARQLAAARTAWFNHSTGADSGIGSGFSCAQLSAFAWLAVSAIRSEDDGGKAWVL